MAEQIERLIDDFFHTVRFTRNYVERTARAKSYIPNILVASEKYGIDPILVTIIIRDESGFDEKAVGRKGEIGLMQIMPQFVDGFDLSRPAEQIEAGCEQLRAAVGLCGPKLSRQLAYYGSGNCNHRGRWVQRRVARYWRAKRNAANGQNGQKNNSTQ
jgi:hypothetical protein